MGFLQGNRDHAIFFLKNMSSTGMKKMLTVIDGSYLEGGGQVLRMAMGFSALTMKPIRIEKIRGQRSKPGLKAQHLSGIRLIRSITDGQLSGDELHSNELEFYPLRGPLGGRTFHADTQTAGAVTLLAQVALPCLLAAKQPSTLDLKGGTNADMAPQIDYLEQILRPNLSKFGCSFRCDLKRKGYFPRGGGHVVIHIDEPVHSIRAVELLNQGDVVSIHISASVAGSLSVKIAEEMALSAKQTLTSKLSNAPVDVQFFRESSAFGNGSSIIIRAETSTGCVLGGDAVGSPKTKPRVTGEQAAKQLLETLQNGACVDHRMQDQLIIFMALASGKSKIKVDPLTLHTKTAIFISELMTDAKFSVKDEGKCQIIECDGIGFHS